VTRKRFALVVALLFLALFIFYGTATYLLERVLRQDKERDLEQRLSGIGATLGVTIEQLEPGGLDAAARVLASNAVQDALLSEAVAAFRQTLQDILDDVKASEALDGITILTDDGIILATTDIDPNPFLAELDKNVIARAVRRGRSAATEFYSYEGRPQKRVYAPIVSPGPGQASILVRLEAPAEYAQRFEAVKRRTWFFLFIGGGIIFAVGLSTLGLMRRLERSSRELAKQDRLRSLGTLASGLAHELRNPLAIMRLTSESLPQDNSAVAAGIKDILEEIDRSSGLISDILAFARGEAVPGAEGRCDALEVLNSTLLWVKKTVPVSWLVTSNLSPMPSGNWSVAIRSDALRQVLLNVLRNAVEILQARGAGAAPGKIDVTLGRDEPGKRVTIRIADNGPGVPPSLRAQLFEPFVSGKEEGTGLGLAISRRLLESVGGELTLEDESPLGGAAFKVTVPS